MSDKRDTQIVNGILSDGFEFKGMHFKPMSARILIMLEKAKSPFYLGGDQLRGLLDFLFISSQETKDVLKALNTDTFEEAVMDFAETFSPSDLQQLSQMIEKQNEDSSAAVVEVREKDAGKKKK